MNQTEINIEPITAERVIKKLALLRAFDDKALHEVARVVEASVPLYDELCKGKNAEQAALGMADGIVSWLYIWAGRTKCPKSIQKDPVQEKYS